MNGADEIGILRHSGLRCTPQRVAIVREVFTRRRATAYEVYKSVRRYFPTIGLATVYNTLRTMTERGLVAELPFSSDLRFDATMTAHANLVCRKCARIEDVEFAPDYLDALLQHVKQMADFAPDGQCIDIYGVCRSCTAPGMS
jgi:Fe2+ or Zn2+ uptake regulation protein